VDICRNCEIGKFRNSEIDRNYWKLLALLDGAHLIGKGWVDRVLEIIYNISKNNSYLYFIKWITHY